MERKHPLSVLATQSIASPAPTTVYNVSEVSPDNSVRFKTAIAYCEANFGGIDGKTANGLVRHSEKYKILSIIDSEKAGLDTGFVLDEEPNGIPIVRNLADALNQAEQLPDYFIFGIAPASGMLSPTERKLVLEAIDHGMNIVNGLHEFLNDDPEFVAASLKSNVVIRDVRRPRPKRTCVFSAAISPKSLAHVLLF